MSKSNDQARAEWVAKLAIAYSRIMTDANRIALLGAFYDMAHANGCIDGGEAVATAVRERLSA